MDAGKFGVILISTPERGMSRCIIRLKRNQDGLSRLAPRVRVPRKLVAVKRTVLGIRLWWGVGLACGSDTVFILHFVL